MAPLARGLIDADPLVRPTAVAALEGAEPATPLRLAAPLLANPIRSLRIEAGHVL
jgi:hypothetical protein